MSPTSRTCEGGGEAIRPHPNGSSGPVDRSRMGGRGRSTGHRSVFGSGKGVVGDPQDLWDREGGHEEDHHQTWSHPTQ